MGWFQKVPIGQYVSGKTGWLRWIDPRLKISWVLFFLITPILASSVWRLSLVIALLLITIFSFLPRRIWGRSISFLLLISLIIGIFAMMLPASEPSASLTIRNPLELSNVVLDGPSWEIIKLGPIKFFNISFGSLVIDRRSAELGIKSSTLIFTVVHSVNLMLITSSPEDLVWALRWFLSPLLFFGFPIDRLSFQLLLALRFIPLIQEEFQNLMRSLSTRAVAFKKLGVKASFGLILSICERLLANILLRSQQGADALIARNGSLSSSRYLRPKSYILRLSLINIFTGLFLFLGLTLRFKLGGY